MGWCDMENKSKKVVKTEKETNYLTQILINVMVLGIFVLIETWLLFFMLSDSFVLPMIFGILIILSGCLLTINIYQFIISRTNQGTSSEEEKKLQLYIVRQLKQQEKRLDQLEESIKKNELLATKAIIKRMEEIVAETAMYTQNQSQQMSDKKEIEEDIEKRELEDMALEDNPEQLLDDSNLSNALKFLSESEDYDPNKQLTDEEIAAMFASV